MQILLRVNANNNTNTNTTTTNNNNKTLKDFFKTFIFYFYIFYIGGCFQVRAPQACRQYKVLKSRNL